MIEVIVVGLLWFFIGWKTAVVSYLVWIGIAFFIKKAFIEPQEKAVEQMLSKNVWLRLISKTSPN